MSNLYSNTSCVRLHVRERGSDIWHHFKSVPRAAQYALMLDQRLRHRVAIPISICEGDAVVWGACSVDIFAPRVPSATLRELAGTAA